MMGSKTRLMLRPVLPRGALIGAPMAPWSFSVCVFKWVSAPSAESRHEFDQNTCIGGKLPCYHLLNVESLENPGKVRAFCVCPSRA